MMMALNAETEKRWWLCTPKLRSDGDSERQNWEVMVALNAETKNDDGFERWNWEWWWLWTPKLRSDGGFGRQNWEAMMTLNVEIENDDGSKHWN